MSTKFAIPLFLLLVLFTIVLPNHQFITRVKASLTLMEFEISRTQTKEEFASEKEITSDTTVAFENESPHVFDMNPATFAERVYNPSLNFLYRAHSPPA